MISREGVDVEHVILIQEWGCNMTQWIKLDGEITIRQGARWNFLQKSVQCNMRLKSRTANKLCLK